MPTAVFQSRTHCPVQSHAQDCLPILSHSQDCLLVQSHAQGCLPVQSHAHGCLPVQWPWPAYRVGQPRLHFGRQFGAVHGCFARRREGFWRPGQACANVGSTTNAAPAAVLSCHFTQDCPRQSQGRNNAALHCCPFGRRSEVSLGRWWLVRGSIVHLISMAASAGYGATLAQAWPGRQTPSRLLADVQNGRTQRQTASQAEPTWRQG